MSATINVELFYNYFKEDSAKLWQVPGRLYPIKIIYMPPTSVDFHCKTSVQTQRAPSRLDPKPFVQVLSLIDQKYSLHDRGDVLIFVSGVNEIRSICDAVKEYAEQQSHWIILPLHSGLSLMEQDKVFDFAPEGMRKCIVSTNIAETSLTVDGIRFVIDSGKVKEMSYDPSCKGQRLKEFWVSKSSAEQRKGRAGRTGPGICFRLFSEKQYASFDAYPTPEIFRVPLDTILLQMISMGLTNVRKFPFVESPGEDNIERTILSLKYHNALTSDEKITALGKSLSNLPVEISIGKMLLMGCVFPNIEKILTLAAVMSVQTPFTNRAYTDPKCENARSSLISDQGDVFIILRAYHEWLRIKWNREDSRKWCHKLGIEEQRFYEVTKLRHQFQNILKSCNMTRFDSVDELSSSERARRHGEVRMLQEIKRKHKYQEPRQRKILKHNTDRYSDIEDDKDDIRDIDFRLCNDNSKLKILVNSSKSDKLHDAILLKLVIVSGFYPQFAIADEFNYCKGGNQQFFHTYLKPFISVHPNSHFSKSFDILKLNDSDILDKPSYYTSKQILSEAHQILCYQNLLETAKPYLLNCIRMPAAQSLLLFSYSIDTNASVSRVICDSWLCLEFPVPESGCELLQRAIKLRRLWNELLMNKLSALEFNGENKSKLRWSSDIKNIKEELWYKLIDFMNANVAYTIKRLLPADLKAIYTQKPLLDFEEKFKINPFAKDYKVSANYEKGGVNICENVVYNCLQEQEWSQNLDIKLSSHTWTCNYCSKEMSLNVAEKLLHKTNCIHRQNYCNKKHDTELSAATSNPNACKNDKKYYCSNCSQELFISNIDILKHKKSCR